MEKTLKLFFCFFFLCCINLKPCQAQPTTAGIPCSTNTTATTTTYPCKTYVYYRAKAPVLLDLTNISDLFGVSRPVIAKASNITVPSAPLVPDQSLLIPIDCSCNFINASFGSISYAPLIRTIVAGDTFYVISTDYYGNLTTYESVEVANPIQPLMPLNLTIGDTAIIPVFCKCPTSDQVKNGIKYLISYVFQPSDDLPSVARKLGSTTSSIIGVNGYNISIFDTLFVPVSQLPQFSQPVPPPPPPPPSPPPAAAVNANPTRVVRITIDVSV